VRGAPEEQQLELWRQVGEQVAENLQTYVKSDEQPLWLSTDGSGVPWLHVRLDSKPKYIKHLEYRSLHIHKQHEMKKQRSRSRQARSTDDDWQAMDVDNPELLTPSEGQAPPTQVVKPNQNNKKQGAMEMRSQHSQGSNSGAPVKAPPPPPPLPPPPSSSAIITTVSRCWACLLQILQVLKPVLSSSSDLTPHFT
jgi:hypothetical protein